MSRLILFANGTAPPCFDVARTRSFCMSVEVDMKVAWNDPQPIRFLYVFSPLYGGVGGRPSYGCMFAAVGRFRSPPLSFIKIRSMWHSLRPAPSAFPRPFCLRSWVSNCEHRLWSGFCPLLARPCSACSDWFCGSGLDLKPDAASIPCSVCTDTLCCDAGEISLAGGALVACGIVFLIPLHYFVVQ